MFLCVSIIYQPNSKAIAYFPMIFFHIKKKQRSQADHICRQNWITFDQLMSVYMPE